MLDDWLTSINDQETVGIMYIDFCKAFDLVNHEILLEKMKAYRFSDNALQWFTSYMSNRKQYVKIESTSSREQVLKSGVPQGSILGPVSFLLIINDLPLQPSLRTTSIFDDDATTSASGKTKQEVENKLQNKSNDLNDWCVTNKMIVSIDKTKLMLLDPKQKRRLDDNTDLQVSYQGKPLKQVTSEKLLGVQIDQALSWDEQIKKQKQTILFKISLLNKIKRYLPQSTRITFHNYYIKPHFEYCNTIWSNCSKSGLDKMAKLQKRAARIILGEKFQREKTTSSAELFKKLNWITFSQNTDFRKAQLIYKSLNNLAPPYMRKMFKYIHEVVPRPLRSATNNELYIPKAHPKSLRHSGPRTWNSLPKEIRNAKNIKEFKRLYLKHIS